MDQVQSLGVVHGEKHCVMALIMAVEETNGLGVSEMDHSQPVCYNSREFLAIIIGNMLQQLHSLILLYLL